MDGSAIVMLCVGAVFLWGGFALAAASYWRASRREAEASTRDRPTG